MALNKKRIDAKNRADEMIEQMSGSNLASEYASGLAALSSKPIIETERKTTDTDNALVFEKPGNGHNFYAKEDATNKQQVYGPPVPNGFVKPEVTEKAEPLSAPALTKEDSISVPTKETETLTSTEETVASAPAKEIITPVSEETKKEILSKNTVSDIPIQKEITPKIPKAPGRRGARTKAERGEECRVQFSTTLTPDMLERIKQEAKNNYMPLSAFIEKVFVEYFSVH